MNSSSTRRRVDAAIEIIETLPQHLGTQYGGH